MRRPLLSIAAAALVALAAFAVWFGRTPDPPPASRAPAEHAAGQAARPEAPAEAAPGREQAAGLPPAVESEAAPAVGSEPIEDPFGGSDNGWAAVDLETVRAAMPDNLYWQMSAPTTDPELLRWREEERARWNVEYGKVLSNTATEEEILAYFDHRDRLASDYIEFITHILENYGENLTLRDVGLLKVAAELNLARLEEIPRQLADALDRRKAHEAAREAWLRDEAAFAAGKATR